jgi:hypothetical protein
MHIHVHHVDGEAKFWLQPKIELAQNYGLTGQQLDTVRKILAENENEVRSAWTRHFES